MLYSSDLITQYLPWYYIVSQSIKQLQIPHWISSIYGGGYPLLAQGETGILSPINFIVLFLMPFPPSVNFLYLVYGLIAISGVYLFLKAHNLDNLSSVFGAITFIFSGFFLTRYFQPSIIFTAALLPWGFYLIKKSQVNAKVLFILTLLIYLQITAGHLQIVFISIAAYIAYTALTCLFNKQKFALLAKVVTFLCLGLLLSSIQILPSAKLFDLSQRRNWDKNMIFSYSLPPSHLVTYLSPNAFGVSQPGDDLNFSQFGGGFWEINITVWTLPFILSLLPAFLIITKRADNKDLTKAITIFYIMWIAPALFLTNRHCRF